MNSNLLRVTEQAAKLKRASDEDIIEALCLLSRTEKSFADSMSEMQGRIELLHPPLPPLQNPKPAARQAHAGAVVPQDVLHIFWLLLTGSAAVAFALGFYFARHAA